MTPSNVPDDVDALHNLLDHLWAQRDGDILNGETPERVALWERRIAACMHAIDTLALSRAIPERPQPSDDPWAFDHPNANRRSDKMLAVRVEARPRSTLEEFAVRHGLEMVVRERSAEFGFPEGHHARWYAQFEGADIGEHGCLRGTFGNGRTPEEAIRNYGPEISEKHLVVDSRKPSRREIDVPIIVPPTTPDSESHAAETTGEENG